MCTVCVCVWGGGGGDRYGVVIASALGMFHNVSCLVYEFS